jgi:hypothetical protein
MAKYDWFTKTLKEVYNYWLSSMANELKKIEVENCDLSMLKALIFIYLL